MFIRWRRRWTSRQRRQAPWQEVTLKNKNYDRPQAWQTKTVRREEKLWYFSLWFSGSVLSMSFLNSFQILPVTLSYRITYLWQLLQNWFTENTHCWFRTESVRLSLQKVTHKAIRKLLEDFTPYLNKRLEVIRQQPSLKSLDIIEKYV